MSEIDVGELERDFEDAVVDPVGDPKPDEDGREGPLRPGAPAPGGEAEEHEGERLHVDPVYLDKFEHTAA